MSDYEEILYDVSEGIATITLNRPDRLNAYTATMSAEVKRAMADATADDAVRVIVLTGEGRGFCAGADMDTLQGIDGSTGETVSAEEREKAKNDRSDFQSDLGPSLADQFRGEFGYMFECPKPIIGAINGPIAGIGLVMAMFCDVRIAADEAKFTTAFSQRGLIAEYGISWLLPRLIGSANALDILMSARKFTGEEAARLGLVNRSVPGNALMGEVRDYAKNIAETVSPRSMTVMKRQVYQALFEDFNSSLERADKEMVASFSSDDFKEGVSHFVEKRAPNFTGS